jgi:hypothetical protein
VENPESKRLDGWKEIAKYFHRDIRTVQRWEQREGLPIRRHDGDKPGVFAYAAELQELWDRKEREWQATKDAEPAAPEPPITNPEPFPIGEPASAPRIRYSRVVAITAVVALAICGVWLCARLQRLPSHPVPANLPDRVFARADSENGVVHSAPVRGMPTLLRLAPKGGDLYVGTQKRNDGLQVVDPDRLTVVREIDVPGGVASLLVDPDGRTLYIGTFTGGLRVLDRNTLSAEVIRSGIDGVVKDLLLTPDGRRLYITLEPGGLRRLDPPERRLTTVWRDRCPEYLALDRTGRYLSGSLLPSTYAGLPVFPSNRPSCFPALRFQCR